MHDGLLIYNATLAVCAEYVEDNLYYSICQNAKVEPLKLGHLRQLCSIDRSVVEVT